MVKSTEIPGENIIDQVRHALSAPGVCSRRIVENVKVILGSKHGNEDAVKPSKDGPSGNRQKKSAVPPANQSKTARKTALTVSIHDDHTVELSTTQQLNFAIDVVNRALQRLSDPAASGQNRTSLTSTKPESNSDTSPVPSLQARAVNRTTQTASNSRSTKTSSKAPKDNPEMTASTAAAECGRVAYAFLRMHFAQGGKALKSSDWKLEAGMLAFVGKLLACGMIELAARELRALKQHLQTRFRAAQSPSTHTISGELTGDPVEYTEAEQHETIATLLSFDAIGADGLQYAINFQLLVLRLVAMSRKTALVKAIADNLVLSCSSSPINLLLALSEQPGCRDRAAQQLEVCAQLITAIASTRTLSSSESSATLALPSAAPVACFRLQGLALQTRAIWMKLAGHRCDTDKEIFKPLYKSLLVYTQSSVDAAVEKYDVAREVVDSVMEGASKLAVASTPHNAGETSHRIDIAIRMSELAQSTNQPVNALKSIDDELERCPEQYFCLLKIRRETLRLNNSKSPSHMKDAIHEMAKSLDSTIPATVEGTTAILSEYLQFRQILMSQYDKARHDDKTGSDHYVHNEAVMSMIRFTRRCLNHFTDLVNGVGPQETTAFRSQLIMVAEKGVETLTYWHSRVVDENADRFPDVDAVLTESLELLRDVQALQPHEIAPKPCTTFSLLFQTYWMWFIKLKSMPGSSSAALDCARKACSCLLERPEAERFAAGLPKKLLKLAAVLIDEGQMQRAREALTDSISCVVKSGALPNSPIPDFSHISTSQIDRGVLDVLQLALERYLHFMAQGNISGSDEPVFYDREELSIETRRLLLDWQTRVLEDCGSSRSLRILASTAVPQICNKMLGLYSDNILQRGRLSLRLIRLESDRNFVVTVSMIDQAEKCAAELARIYLDCDGASHGVSISCSLTVALALRNGSMDSQIVDRALSIWKNMTSSSAAGNTDEHIDIFTILNLLRSLLDFCEANGLLELQTRGLSLLLQLEEVNSKEHHRSSAETRINLGLHLLDLGCPEEAGVQLRRAKQALDRSPGARDNSKIELAYAEYHLWLGNVETSRQHLLAASKSESLDHVQLTQSQDANRAMLGVDTMHIQSLIHLSSGSMDEALVLLQFQLGLIQKSWRSFSIATGDVRQSSSSPHGLAVEAVTNGLSVMTVSDSTVPKKVGQRSLISLDHAARWPVARRMLQSHLQLSSAFRHKGMVQEASYYLQQAEQLAKTLSSPSFVAAALTQRGDLLNHSCSIDDGAQLLDEASSIYSTLTSNLNAVLHHSLHGHLHHLEAQWPPAFEQYGVAEERLGELGSFSWLQDLKITTTQAVADLAPKPAPSRSAASRTKSNKTVTKTLKPAPQPNSNTVPGHCLGRMAWMGLEIMRLKAESTLAQGDVQNALELIANLEAASGDIDFSAHQRTIKAQVLVAAGLKDLSRDPIFGMLAESTISFPAVVLSAEKQSGKGSAPKPLTKTTKRPQKTSPPSRDLGNGMALSSTLTSHLLQAVESLSCLATTTTLNISNETLQQQCQTFISGTLLLSAIAPSILPKLLQPAVMAYVLDLPRSNTSIRERTFADLDATKFTYKDIRPLDEKPACSTLNHISVSSFQADLVDAIPDAWDVVSLSLDEKREYLTVTRLNRHRSPFIVRLPLTRSSSEANEEEKFSFEDAKAELEDIVKSSDETVHAARDNPDMLRSKSAKGKWWEDREALDDRLHDLLSNIENIWLGGFRGLFSSHQRQPDLLARLQQSFESILEKHLPSRRKPNKQTDTAHRVKLAAQVFDLFVGLENVCEDESEYDEALMDLLYYVVDILQFNGECNAYDEIDFDTMIVETQDAIASYREAAVGNLPDPPPPRHTILVLDKQLHAFPWESLPCLDGQSVSRITSFYDLHERLIQLRTQQPSTQNNEASAPEIVVSAKHGTCFLNPSGDLTKTQSRFERAVSTIDNSWTVSINSPPSEEQFIAALTPRVRNTPEDTQGSGDPQSHAQSNILLYFGHGSGAQYIRHKHIKRLRTVSLLPRPSSPTPPPLPTQQQRDILPTANLPLLFGCSSAHLHIPGIFNAHGTPVSYLIAGAPAVLGSLWDVTDGDCDAFATETLEAWGLFGRGACCVDVKGKGKGKAGRRGADVRRAQRAKENEEGGNGGDGSGGRGRRVEDGWGEERFGIMCLSEAAARGRRKCYLRYLNGAAMVVYGVPVVLGER